MTDFSHPPVPTGLSVRAALDCVLAQTPRLAAERVALFAALGRSLAEEIRAPRDLPPWDVSAMDGYAVLSADLSGAEEKAPCTLTVVEDIKAGDTPQRTLASGECARIMTGAPLPHGADAVVRVEDTRALADGRVHFRVAAKPGTDIRKQGENMRTGEVVLAPGAELTPAMLGVLASLKCAEVAVTKRPRVAILATGDELEAIDAPADANKIPDANSYALLGAAEALGAEATLLGIAHDEPEELAEWLTQGLDHHDVLLVSGGTSVGVHDHVRPTLERLGVVLHFWRVEMRPGHPVAFGSRDDTLVFCLPGNPVSSLVCFEQFVLPALRALSGHRRLFRRTLMARLTKAVRTKPGRAEFVRVALTQAANGEYAATPLGTQSSGDLRAMAEADGLLAGTGDAGELAAGAWASVQLLAAGAFQGAPREDANI